KDVVHLFFFSSRRRHTRFSRDWSSDVCSSDLQGRRGIDIALATTDIGEAVRDAELIVAPLPAFAQDELARALAPHLRDGQVVYLDRKSVVEGKSVRAVVRSIRHEDEYCGPSEH